MRLSPLAQKAIALLRGHYVYVVHLIPNPHPGYGFYRYKYVWDYGVYNTHTGMRIMGFGKHTFEELKRGRLLRYPMIFPTPYHDAGRDERVYSLNRRGLDVFVMAMVLNAVAEFAKEERERWYQ